MSKQSDEHHQKYEALAQWLGVGNLLALVPFTAKRVKGALDDGDVHLNTLPLHTWDGQHDRVLHLVKSVRARDPRAARANSARRNWSLSSTVCVLKHVARHHLNRLLEGGNRNW